MQVGILEPQDFSNEAISLLKKVGPVKFFTGRDIKNFVKDKEVLFIRLNYFIGGDLLAAASKLKFICTPTTGLNHLDLKEIKKRKIKIISLKGEIKFLSNVRATPENAFALMLSLLRNYKGAFLNEKNKEWNRDKYKGHEVYEKQVGIIGFGRVGKILARYFSAFGASVFFYDTNKEIKPIFRAKKVSSIKDLIKKTDIIFLAAAYTSANEKFFDKKYIDLLKNKYFINVARGELIDENYLLKKIKANFFKGIALDVIDKENGQNKLSQFLKLTHGRNFILTPHISGATYESMAKTEIFIAKKLLNKR